MTNMQNMFDNIKVAIVASDKDFNVIYQNNRCRELFKELFKREDYIGTNLSECHKPETTAKLKMLYQDYKERKKILDYFVMDLPGRKGTLVNVPFYTNDNFAGVVEFIFESSLD